jgi:hypothetical protein
MSEEKTMGCFSIIGYSDPGDDYWMTHAQSTDGLVCDIFVKCMLGHLPDEILLTVYTNAKVCDYPEAKLLIQESQSPLHRSYMVRLPYKLARKAGMIEEDQVPEVAIYYELGEWLEEECGLKHGDTFNWKIEEVES